MGQLHHGSVMYVLLTSNSTAPFLIEVNRQGNRPFYMSSVKKEAYSHHLKVVFQQRERACKGETVVHRGGYPKAWCRVLVVEEMVLRNCCSDTLSPTPNYTVKTSVHF